MMKYDMQIQSERIGATHLDIECLADLESSIDRMFEHLEKEGCQELLKELCPYFGVPWPAGRALASMLELEGPEKLCGKSMLEVGCGLALPSLIAARCGAVVTASDCHPDVAILLEKNLRRNQVSGVTHVKWDWSHPDMGLGTYDLVCASDVLYEREQVPTLIHALVECCGQYGTIYVADPQRPYLHEFIRGMRERGFCDHRRVFAKGDVGGDQDVVVVKFLRRDGEDAHTARVCTDISSQPSSLTGFSLRSPSLPRSTSFR